MQHQQKWINIDEEFLYTDCSGACGSDSRLVGCWFWASFLSKLAHVHRNLLELCPWVEYNLPWPPSLPVWSWLTGGEIATIVTPGGFWAPCPGYWRPMVGCSVTGRAYLLVAEEMTPDYIDWLLWFILHRPPAAEVIILLELVLVHLNNFSMESGQILKFSNKMFAKTFCVHDTRPDFRLLDCRHQGRPCPVSTRVQVHILNPVFSNFSKLLYLN